jgi:hypothetical protein
VTGCSLAHELAAELGGQVDPDGEAIVVAGRRITCRVTGQVMVDGDTPLGYFSHGVQRLAHAYRAATGTASPRPADGALDARGAAAALGVPVTAVYDWKHRGRAAPVGYLQGVGRGGKVPLYLLDELRPLAIEYHQRRARRADGGGAGPAGSA